MQNFSNIEKSGFHKGQYVGYGGGAVWRITKSNSSYGTWTARWHNGDRRFENTFLHAFRLSDMSTKLADLDKVSA